MLVIGSGFGGLGAALTLAEKGARVCLCETLRYPGGCASTFERGGFRFDAGATLVSGLGEDQLFGKWLARYSPTTEIEWIDPLVELRAPGFDLHLHRDRDRIVRQLCAMPHAPAASIRAFFDEQRRVAAILWKLFDDPTLLPPFSLRSLLTHARGALRYATLTPLLGRSLRSVIESFEGLATFEPLTLYVDALCQITVQCSAADAEATFALAAMDYYYRGTAHVRGGVGSLAHALLQGVKTMGADVRMSTRVTGLRRDHDGSWIASTRRGEVHARSIVANLVPGALERMLDPTLRLSSGAEALRARARPIDDAWGAAMLYVVARTPESARDEAHHLQLVLDDQKPLAEGNHLFVSASSASETERAPAGHRALTISTHIPLTKLRGSEASAEPGAAGRYVAEAQAAMRRTLEARAPEWSRNIVREMTASPRTFERFVGRPHGAVGGLPRKVGLASYAGIGPQEVLDRVWLVGDSVFPGQSALATAIGGVRTAEVMSRSAIFAGRSSPSERSHVRRAS